MIKLNHVAIIMDGNGRWAKKNHKRKVSGHLEGVKIINNVISFSLKNNIKTLTLYALSYDNFRKRSSSEILNIFKILKKYLNEKLSYFQENNIHLNFIGELQKLPNDIKILLNFVSKKTKFKKNKLIINIAFNYSSKLEILNTFKILKKQKKKLNIQNFNNLLYTKGVSDPEILIRTGAYQRLSDFLLWQNSYTEMFFLKKLWPEFSSNDLKKIIKNYSKINRNFGS